MLQWLGEITDGMSKNIIKKKHLSDIQVKRF